MATDSTAKRTRRRPAGQLIPLPLAAERLGIEVQTLRKAVRRGEIRSVKLGKRRYLTQEIIASILNPALHETGRGAH